MPQAETPDPVSLEQLEAGELPQLTPESCRLLSSLMTDNAYEAASGLGWRSQVEALVDMPFPDALERAFEVARDTSNAETSLGIDDEQRRLLIKVGDAALERGDVPSIALAVKVAEAYEKPIYRDRLPEKYKDYGDYVATMIVDIASGIEIHGRAIDDLELAEKKMLAEAAQEAAALRTSAADTLVDLYRLHRRWWTVSGPILTQEQTLPRMRKVIDANLKVTFTGRPRAAIAGLTEILDREFVADAGLPKTREDIRDLVRETAAKVDDPRDKVTLLSRNAGNGDFESMRLLVDFVMPLESFERDRLLASVVHAGARYIFRSGNRSSDIAVISDTLRAAHAIDSEKHALRSRAFVAAAEAVSNIKKRMFGIRD